MSLCEKILCGKRSCELLQSVGLRCLHNSKAAGNHNKSNASGKNKEGRGVVGAWMLNLGFHLGELWSCFRHTTERAASFPTTHGCCVHLQETNIHLSFNLYTFQYL